MEVLRELVPPFTRQLIYGIYALVGIAVGAVQAAGIDATWVEPTINVLAYLAVPIAVLAGVNVPADDYAPRYKAE